MVLWQRAFHWTEHRQIDAQRSSTVTYSGLVIVRAQKPKIKQGKHLPCSEVRWDTFPSGRNRLFLKVARKPKTCTSKGWRHRKSRQTWVGGGRWWRFFPKKVTSWWGMLHKKIRKETAPHGKNILQLQNYGVGWPVMGGKGSHDFQAGSHDWIDWTSRKW